VRSLVLYSDDAGNPCPKSKATHAEVQEFDAEGAMIARTYADLKRPG
jgi:hypothetical protein